jgi:hypothetical protein
MLGPGELQRFQCGLLCVQLSRWMEVRFGFTLVLFVISFSFSFFFFSFFFLLFSGYSCLVPPDFVTHLAKAVGPLVGEQEVVLVLSNDRDWFWNYLHWLRQQPKMLARLMLVCSDEASQKSIPIKARAMGLELECPVVGVEKFWTNDSWGGFTQLKQVVLLEVLKYGFGVLQMDTDMGIIRDPLPFIQGDVDFEFTSDAWDTAGVRGGHNMEKFASGGHQGNELNIGVTYARGGADKVLDFIARVWVRLADFKMRNEYTYDQSTFNVLLRPDEPNQVCTFSSLTFFFIQFPFC